MDEALVGSDSGSVPAHGGTHRCVVRCDLRSMETSEAPTPEEAEEQFRELIDDGDLPQPDRVDFDARRR